MQMARGSCLRCRHALHREPGPQIQGPLPGAQGAVRCRTLGGMTAKQASTAGPLHRARCCTPNFCVCVQAWVPSAASAREPSLSTSSQSTTCCRMSTRLVETFQQQYRCDKCCPGGHTQLTIHVLVGTSPGRLSRPLPAGAALRGLLPAPPAGRIRWEGSPVVPVLPHVLGCYRPFGPSQTYPGPPPPPTVSALQCLDTTTPSASCTLSCASGVPWQRPRRPAAARCSPCWVRSLAATACPAEDVAACPPCAVGCCPCLIHTLPTTCFDTS